ncbi:MAG: hypothetical protein QME96_15625, partial [Myxococcota bacterium]|nr:hypothetical protein [Myxococcota bacterium]
MQPSKTKKRKTVDLAALLALMEPWPRSWRGSDADIPVGEGLVAEMKPFIAHLCSLDLAPSTVHDHLDSCWIIGGEIIRDVVGQPERRELPPRRLLMESMAYGMAPFVGGATEEEQRSFDATARRLLRFLTSRKLRRPFHPQISLESRKNGKDAPMTSDQHGHAPGLLRLPDRRPDRHASQPAYHRRRGNLRAQLGPQRGFPGAAAAFVPSNRQLCR